MEKRNLFFNARAWIVASAILITGATISSCNKNNDDDEDVALAGVMAFNLAPDGRTASFVASDRLIANSPLVFNTFTGAYLGVRPGTQTIGAVNTGGGGILASMNYNLEANKYYSVFLVGNDPDYSLVIEQDKFDTLVSTTQAFVRYLNAIPEASHPNVTITSTGGTVFNETTSFKNISPFKAINPGAVTITVSNGTTINVTRTITLEAQKIYTILLTGKPGGAGGYGVQIKYIQNGTTGTTIQRMTAASATNPN